MTANIIECEYIFSDVAICVQYTFTQDQDHVARLISAKQRIP